MEQLNSNKNILDDLYASLKDYLDMRIDDAKLTVTENLAVLCSRLIIFVLVTIISAIAFGFMATALSSWIGTILNSPTLGALITGGLFLLTAVILFIFRKKLFVNSLVRMFAGMIFKKKETYEPEE